MSGAITEESVSFPCGELSLSGVLSYPEQNAAALAVLLCAPHPNFAGNMENNVIRALALDLSRDAMVLRFDYRGVGASEIRLPAESSVFDYWSEAEQTQNYSDALADVTAAAAALTGFSKGLPIVIVGYSFGAIVGLMAGNDARAVRALVGIAPPMAQHSFAFLNGCRKPCLLLSGSEDFVYSAQVCEAESRAWPACVQTRILDGHDHFFRESEAVLCARVRGFIETALRSN